MTLAPPHFLVATLAGWRSCYLLEVVESLQEENRVLLEQLDGKRLQSTDAQRRRLAR